MTAVRIRFFGIQNSHFENRVDDNAIAIWPQAKVVPRKDDYITNPAGEDWRVAYVIWRQHGEAVDVLCTRLEYRV